MDVTVTRRYLFATLLAGIALLAGCGGDSTALIPPPLPEVVVTSVQRGEVPVDLTYSGRTAGSREVEVRARVSGILLQRLYEEGSHVREGDVLFRIDPEQLELGYTEVRAPISGLTSREARSEGSRVTAGEDSSLLTRIVQTDPLYVEFSIAESEAALLRGALTSNRPPTVRLVLDDATQHATPGTLTFIDNAVDRRSGTVLARAVLPNPGVALLPGQFIGVRLSGVSLMAAVSLPRRAVMTSTNGSFVWVVDKGQVVELRPVVLGRAIGEQTVIQEGLTGGERVIVEGVFKVQPGVTVRIVNLAKPGTRTAAATPAAARQLRAGEQGGCVKKLTAARKIRLTCNSAALA